MFKTLVASTTDDRHVVGIVPVATQLDLKALAAAVDAKHADMARPRTRNVSPVTCSAASARSVRSGACRR